MSIPQGPSNQPPGAYPPAGSPAGGPLQYQPPAPAQGTSGLAIAGLVLAFLAAPIGLILSLIALPGTGAGKKKGRGLAITGIVVSLLLTGGGVAVIFLVKDNVKNITTIADPGCTQGKDVILANADLGGGTDPAVMKTKLQTLITGLDKAAAAAKHDDVRAAMTALSADYKALLQGLNTGQMPPDLTTKVSTDANKIDDLCTLGGAQK